MGDAEMDKVDIKDLPEILDDRYLMIVSTDEVDIKSLDKILNINNIITGLVDEYTIICNSDGFTSLLIKVDQDSEINKDKINKKVNDYIYVCDTEHYYEYIKSYSHGSHSSKDDFNMSDMSYGYNDMKLIMKESGDNVVILLLIPFSGTIDLMNQISSVFKSLFKLSYGYDIDKEEVDDDMSSLVLKYKVPLSVLKMHGRRNFDFLLNQLLPIINIDKFTSMEYISYSDKIKSLLN